MPEVAETMSQRKIAGCNAVVFCIFWLVVLLAGADKPPPPGFLWIVLTVAVCSVVVYWRTPTYLGWHRTRRPGRYWRVVLDGFSAGLFVALPLALKGSGEPSSGRDAADFAIWFVVVGLVGSFNSLALFLINRIVFK